MKRAVWIEDSFFRAPHEFCSYRKLIYPYSLARLVQRWGIEAQVNFQIFVEAISNCASCRVLKELIAEPPGHNQCRYQRPLPHIKNAKFCGGTRHASWFMNDSGE
jgi:hypothetical protein